MDFSGPFRSVFKSRTITTLCRFINVGFSFFFKRFNTPLIQVVFLGSVSLSGSGMFNASSSLGAGESISANVGFIDSANGALYGCFAIVRFFAGTFTNTVSVKYTLTVSFSKKYHYTYRYILFIDWFD